MNHPSHLAASLAALALAANTLASVAFAANGIAETGKVFGDARRVSDADNGAMALCLEGDRLYVGAGQWLHVYDVSRPQSPKKLGEVGGFGEVVAGGLYG